MPAGKAKISTIARKTIKSRGNLPIPHSEKAMANVVKCIFIFLGIQNLYGIIKY